MRGRGRGTDHGVAGECGIEPQNEGTIFLPIAPASPVWREGSRLFDYAVSVRRF